MATIDRELVAQVAEHAKACGEAEPGTVRVDLVEVDRRNAEKVVRHGQSYTMGPRKFLDMVTIKDSDWLRVRAEQSREAGLLDDASRYARIASMVDGVEGIIARLWDPKGPR